MRTPVNEHLHQILVSISTRLMPYFMVNHPVHGKVLGPFNKLPVGSHTRTLAMDLAWYLEAASGCKELSVAVTEGSTGTDKEYYLSIRS